MREQPALPGIAVSHGPDAARSARGFGADPVKCSPTMSAIAAPATLYVVATPIGNLGDLTGRAREVLAAVEVIFAEDTRVTAILLAHYGIATPMISLHEHNEARRSAQVLERLKAGAAVALVSDAGTPAISDPGARLVREVRAGGFTCLPVPGPSALTAALSVSGVEGPFVFLGFLPPRGAARRAYLTAWASCAAAIVLYESPHRLRDTLGDLQEVFGPARGMVIARELTKRFEAAERVILGEAPAWLDADSNHSRGEFVIVLEPAEPATDRAEDSAAGVLDTLLDELPLAQAVRLAQRITGARRNRLYERALARAKTQGSAEGEP
jgi:16S rRNA (cytidine1402-2'-O)-methyltransferase